MTVTKSARVLGKGQRVLPWVLLGLIISPASVPPCLSKMYRNSQTTTSCISTFSSPQGPVLGQKVGVVLESWISEVLTLKEGLPEKGQVNKNTHNSCP